MFLNEVFANMVDELADKFNASGQIGPYNATMSLAVKMREMDMKMIRHPMKTNHMKCENCGQEVRYHEYLVNLKMTVCPRRLYD